MRVRHAKLLDVLGRPARVSGWTLVPAVLDRGWGGWSAGVDLAAFAGDPPPPLAAALRFGFDAAWVRARLPYAFGFTPDPTEAEKCLLWVDFLAVPDGGTEAIPFACSDHYGRTSVWFSDDEADADSKGWIADAFWGWLLSEPDDLADFEASVYHSSSGAWLDFGCRRGEPYCDERADNGA